MSLQVLKIILPVSLAIWGGGAGGEGGYVTEKFGSANTQTALLGLNL
jgi:hypothetical protein